MTGERVYFAFDQEGILTNPGLDFAHVILYRMLPAPLKEQYADRIANRFDAYDDARWLYERGERGHNTGTTPLMALFAAACAGLTDKQLIQQQQLRLCENPGVSELVHYVHENGEPPLIITSSYPAGALTLAQRYGMPFDNVFSLGYQRGTAQRDPSKSVEDEVINWRSPLRFLLQKREGLQPFMDSYLDLCERMLGKLENGRYVSEGRRQDLEKLKEEEIALFNGIGDVMLKLYLKDLLQRENGIMGSHNKARVMEARNGNRNWIYLGDGIVDADPLQQAQYGIAVNCTNRYALESAKLDIATVDMSNAIPVFEDITQGRFTPQRAKKMSKDGFTVFTPQDIQDNPDYVIDANRASKNAQRELVNV